MPPLATHLRHTWGSASTASNRIVPESATCPSQPPGVRWSLLPGLSSCPIAFPLAHLPWEALTLPAPAPISCRISDPPFPPGAWLSFCKYVFLLITCVSVFVTLMELWAP